MALAGPWVSDKSPRAEHQHLPARALSHCSWVTLSCLSCLHPPQPACQSQNRPATVSTGFHHGAFATAALPAPPTGPGRGAAPAPPNLYHTTLCPSLQLCSWPQAFLICYTHVHACVVHRTEPRTVTLSQVPALFSSYCKQRFCRVRVAQAGLKLPHSQSTL